MIHTVRIRGFKRFTDATLRLPGHVVLAGPNNTGKTTVLQAIASWALALRRWRELNDFNRRGGYRFAPLARQAFTAVPLRSFDLLWINRLYDPKVRVEVELRHSDGWSVVMEFLADSTEQIYVRPRADTSSETLRELDLGVVFVPPMTGIGIDEPVFQPAKIEQLLGLGRPGEVLRNLLAEANRKEAAWDALQASIVKLFGYKLLPPDTSGAHIRAEYRMADAEGVVRPHLDIASAGSGFQQVLMLLAFLHTRPGTVLLLDEPDAHLHVILQDAIYHELRTVAARQHSQLVVATHSEVVINSVEPKELCVMLNEPRVIADDDERNRLITSLHVLSNADVMQALGVRGVLYVEGHTDIGILRAWAAQLRHRADELLTTEVMWRQTVFQTRQGRVGTSGVKAREHFDALQLVREGLPGLELIDGDAHREIPDTKITGAGLQRLRWRRYEIESYLVHPNALARFVEKTVGANTAAPYIEDMLDHLRREFPPGVVDDPLGDHVFLNGTKARTQLLPPLLDAAGLHGLPYTRYHEIARIMLPAEIHPEVVEKLDAICRAFGVEP
ncbi:MAG: AAA family ATPase [Deltaproteobacteria bacterium]|nr:AAA family ATPase [Deltaproteobacteria bacterium]